MLLNSITSSGGTAPELWRYPEPAFPQYSFDRKLGMRLLFVEFNDRHEFFLAKSLPTTGCHTLSWLRVPTDGILAMLVTPGASGALLFRYHAPTILSVLIGWITPPFHAFESSDIQSPGTVERFIANDNSREPCSARGHVQDQATNLKVRIELVVNSTPVYVCSTGSG